MYSESMYFNSVHSQNGFEGDGVYHQEPATVYEDFCSGSTREDELAPFRTDSSVPRKIMMCLVDNCNFKCGMCTYRPQNVKPLDVSKWNTLIDETKFVNPIYSLFGGEPLLYPQFDELVSYMGENGVNASVVTNAYLLERHYKTLLDNNFDIIISIDGTEKVHNQIRNCPDSFQRIDAALKIMSVEYPEKIKRKVFVNAVILPDNIDVLEDLIEYLRGYGISSISFQHMQYLDLFTSEATDEMWAQLTGDSFKTVLTPRKNYILDKEFVGKVSDFCQSVQELKVKYKDSIYISLHPNLSREEIGLYYSEEHSQLIGKSICLNPWVSAMVSANGDVGLCLDGSIGNIKEDMFWSIWYGEKARVFRDAVRKHVFPVCTRCCNFYNDYFSPHSYLK